MNFSMDANADWNLSKLNSVSSPTLCSKITLMLRPSLELGYNNVSWNDTPNGVFTVFLCLQGSSPSKIDL